MTFYHRHGACYWKKRAHPEFPGTMAQMEAQTIHLRDLQAWRDLSPAVQEIWNTYALSVQSHRPPFKADHHITGHNLFVSAYHGFAQLGEEHVPTPCPFESFPVFWVEFSGVEVVDSENLLLKLHVILGGTEDPQRYRLMTRLQLTSPGRGRQPGYLRSHIAIDNCSDNDCIVSVHVPDYKNIWDLDLQEYQVHMRNLLIDTETGYRCNFKKKSFLLLI
ncbi:MAG: hypothetical protein SPL35_08015 [Bacteroidales bacterium]|nr:hypothetical protein [Bacteroidales bacterium]